MPTPKHNSFAISGFIYCVAAIIGIALIGFFVLLAKSIWKAVTGS